MLRKALTAQALGANFLRPTRYGNNGGTMDRALAPMATLPLFLAPCLVPVSAFTVPSILYSASAATKGRIARPLGLG